MSHPGSTSLIDKERLPTGRRVMGVAASSLSMRSTPLRLAQHEPPRRQRSPLWRTVRAPTVRPSGTPPHSGVQSPVPRAGNALPVRTRFSRAPSRCFARRHFVGWLGVGPLMKIVRVDGFMRLRPQPPGGLVGIQEHFAIATTRAHRREPREQCGGARGNAISVLRCESVGAVAPELVDLASHEADETFAGCGSHERRGDIVKDPLCPFGDRCGFHAETVP